MQGEIIYIIKYGGILFTVLLHYFLVVKTLAVFAERQNVQKILLDKITEEVDKIEHELTVLTTEHKLNGCKK